MAGNANQEAKDQVENKIAGLFGNKFVGNVGGKIYVWSRAQNGDKVQVAISLTCPKNPVPQVADVSAGFDWSDPAPVTQEQKIVSEKSEEEKEAIAKLMASLGL